jgi:ribosome-associated toxin RatA of RatAB toxin-antitoxin module
MNESSEKLTHAAVALVIPADGRDLQDMERRAFALMIDVARYPDYMPSVNSLEILAGDDDQVVTRWDAEIDGAPIRWVQRVWWNAAEHEMYFEAMAGDFDVFRGKWAAGRAEDGVRLELAVDYRLGIPVIEEVLGPILKEKVEANSVAMLEAIAGQLKG